MKNLRHLSFAVFCGVFVPVSLYAQPKTVISSVAFQDPQGNAAANGVLSLQLSVPAEISGGGQTAPSRVKITLDGTGKIPVGTTLWASDQLVPSGDTYYAQLQDSTGRYIAQFGNWYIAGASPIDLALQTPVVVGLSYPSPLLLNPAGAANQTVNGSATITGALTAGLFDNACWIDGTKYATIAAANADTTNCRIIVVPPKPSGAVYTETFSANFTGSATLRGIIFLTDANITMGTNTFTIPSSATSDNFVIWSPFISDGISNNGQGVNFISTATSGTVMTFGGTTQRNAKWNIQGINLDITGAGTGVTGMQFNNLFNSQVNGVGVTCNLSGTNTQGGMIFLGSGTPGFADLVTLENIRPVDCQKPLTLNLTNGYVIYGGASEINCGNTTGGVGLTLLGSPNGGSTFAFFPDVESCPTTGVDIGNNNNKLFIRAENLGGGVAAKFESGVVDNDVLTDTPTITCTDSSASSGRNHCGDVGGGNWPGGAAPTIFPATLLASQTGKLGTAVVTGGSGTARGYGLIGLGQLLSDTTGDKTYGAWLSAKSGFSGANEIAAHLETNNGGNAWETAVNGVLGCKMFGATGVAEDCVEGAAPSGVASHDQIWPDSTAHRWKMLNNNGTADTVVGAATTDTFTNKTLNVPLTSGTGLQIFNTTTTCTTGASAGATCTTAAISLPVAEADTSYRLVCTGKGLTNVPVVIATANSSATQFTITIAALTAAAASFASYDCIAGHN